MHPGYIPYTDRRRIIPSRPKMKLVFLRHQAASSRVGRIKLVFLRHSTQAGIMTTCECFQVSLLCENCTYRHSTTWSFGFPSTKPLRAIGRVKVLGPAAHSRCPALHTPTYRGLLTVRAQWLNPSTSVAGQWSKS